MATCGGCTMESLVFLAPVAFAIALGAYAEVSKLRKEIEALKQELETLR